MYSLASWNIRGNSGLDKLCRKVFRNWHWTSNVAVCTKVSRIILGWNPDVVNVVVVFLMIRGRPRCLLGDFNVSLSIIDKSTCTSYVDIEMRDFQECVKEIEVTDLNSTRLRFTWYQKPRGMDGVLKKIDRIMKSLEASNVFTRASVFFHPYRHTPAIL
ncbi:RNA-directed DNA polymerase, eukaryota, reverse transcriptase zinc-binding domain protein, partial [Tanacetum coccineum]